MRFSTAVIVTFTIFSGCAVGSPIGITNPKVAASTASFVGIDIGVGIDISSFGAAVSEATGAASGMVGLGSVDISFAFDPADPTSLPSGGLPSPFVSIDPAYLVLTTLLSIGSSPGIIDLLFENDDPGSSGYADFNERVLVSIELIGVTGDPFQFIVDAVEAGFGFADFDANIVVQNTSAVLGPGTPLLVLLGLILYPLARRPQKRW